MSRYFVRDPKPRTDPVEKVNEARTIYRHKHRSYADHRRPTASQHLTISTSVLNRVMRGELPADFFAYAHLPVVTGPVTLVGDQPGVGGAPADRLCGIITDVRHGRLNDWQARIQHSRASACWTDEAVPTSVQLVEDTPVTCLHVTI